MSMYADRSEGIEKLAPALVRALGSLTDVARQATAKVETKGGGSYIYSYATLSDVIANVRPVLAANGLAVTQTAEVSDDGFVRVWTTVMHESGQFVTHRPIRFRAEGTPQSIGSAISYGRRYALLAALGVATEDDDGQEAAPKRPAPRKAAARGAEPMPPVKTAPATPRTDAEAEIRRLIGSQSGDMAARLKAEFVEEWGEPLSAMAPDLHEPALFWMRERIETLEALAN